MDSQALHEFQATKFYYEKAGFALKRLVMRERNKYANFSCGSEKINKTLEVRLEEIKN